MNGTLCRCGHLLECCADCMGWMRENSPWIVKRWRFWLDVWGRGQVLATSWAANAAEADDMAYFACWR